MHRSLIVARNRVSFLAGPFVMSEADKYRTLAEEAEARAHLERVPEFRWKWEDLARSYRYLADEADRKFLDVLSAGGR